MSGFLSCVGTGMNLAGQISVISKSYIQNADIVFTHTPHEMTTNWLQQLNPNTVNLHQYYSDGKHRMQTYEDMAEAMLVEVRKGKKVCGAFYGHPGIFACVPHMAIKQAKKEGFKAVMEPGISAEACLYADLAIDPGEVGVQAFESTQFFFFDHMPNTASYVLLWQIGLIGEATGRTLSTSKDSIRAFIDYLSQWYSNEHEVILYEAAVLPIETFRAEKIALNQLDKAQLNMKTTMVIPPARELELNTELLASLGLSKDTIFNRD